MQSREAVTEATRLHDVAAAALDVAECAEREKRRRLAAQLREYERTLATLVAP